MLGVGWGMNRIDLVAAYLQSGAPVELVPEQHVSIALCRQHTRLAMRQMELLSERVLMKAKDLLIQRQTDAVYSDPKPRHRFKQ